MKETFSRMAMLYKTNKPIPSPPKSDNSHNKSNLEINTYTGANNPSNSKFKRKLSSIIHTPNDIPIITNSPNTTTIKNAVYK